MEIAIKIISGFYSELKLSCLNYGYTVYREMPIRFRKLYCVYNIQYNIQYVQHTCRAVSIMIFFILLRWAFSRKMPTYDTDQDIWDTSVTFVNGSLSMSFIRNIYTLKENDYRLDRCVHVLGAWGGQVMSYSSPSQFSKHSSMTVFDQLMCLQSCSGIFLKNIYIYIYISA